SRTQGANEISRSKFLKVEGIRSSRSPEGESVDVLSAVAHHRAIIRYAEEAGWPVRNNLNASVPNFEGAVELDLHLLMLPTNFPRIGIGEQVVGMLPLPAIHERLAEHAVLITEAITGGGQLHGGHRVEETRSKPAQTSVAQTGIRFLLDQFEPIDAFLLD